MNKYGQKTEEKLRIKDVSLPHLYIYYVICLFGSLQFSADAITPSSVPLVPTNLGLPDEYAVIFLTGEVALALHGAIVLAFRLIQYDTHPFPRSKEGSANVGNSAALTLSCHLDYRANLGDKKWIKIL